MRSWSRRRKLVVAGAGLAVLWSVAVVITLLQARSEAAAGGRDLRAVRREASIASLVDPASAARLQAAKGHFDAASRKLASPLLAPLRIVPVASRHLAAAEQLVQASVEGTEVAQDALGELVPLTERPREEGPERVATVRDLAEVADRAEAGLQAIEVGSPKALARPLGDAIAELAEQRAGAIEASHRLSQVAGAVADVLEGPRPYLLLGANNAEMRNGSGMFLSAATLGFDQGRMALGPVSPTAEIVLPAGTVPVEGDLAANWPWLDPGRDLRTLGLSADFPQSAALAAANWAATPQGTEVAGVLVLDVDAIRGLLRVVGPVEADGMTYDADSVRGELLRNQYERFDGEQGERRDQLGQVAHAIFERIQAGAWQLEDLATELVDAVQGRHLLVWSSDAGAQAAWGEVGADGHLQSDSLSVALLNRGAEKLDSWIDTTAEVTTASRADGATDLTLRYEIENRGPSSGSRYLVGPNLPGLEAGDHRGLVVVNLPAGATDVTLDGARQFLLGADGPTVVIAGEVTVRNGTSLVVTVRATLPAEVERVVLEPTARIPRTAWTVDGVRFDRDRRRSVPLASGD